MSYGRKRAEPAVGWEDLAEWTGGLPPDQIRALAAVRPLEAVHSLLRGLAGRTPRELLARAAVLEALDSPPAPPSAIDFEESLSWLSGAARGEALSALGGSGWLEPGPAGTFVLTAVGRQVWTALRRAVSLGAAPALPLLPAGVDAERIAQALLALTLEELAEMGRDALVPILPAFSLLGTDAVARAAEGQVRSAGSGRTGESRTGAKGRPAGPPGGKRQR